LWVKSDISVPPRQSAQVCADNDHSWCRCWFLRFFQRPKPFSSCDGKFRAAIPICSACSIIFDVGMNVVMSPSECGVAVLLILPQRPYARSLADFVPCITLQVIKIAIDGVLDVDRRVCCQDCRLHRCALMGHRLFHACGCLEFVFIALPLAGTAMPLWLLFSGFTAAVHPRAEPICDAASRLHQYLCLPASYAILCISE
jgi:hypothetical protein